VPLLLVRHAVALARRKWDSPDEGRPLTKRGERQADALASRLAEYPVTEVLSSPSVRCVDTVGPLAKARGLSVEISDALAEGSTIDGLELVRRLTGQTAALCSHGDVIPYVLEALVAQDGIDLGEQPASAKGSTWVLEDDGTRFVKAYYIEPPE
jgi:8-oxo-dGTP diphosphatase